MDTIKKEYVVEWCFQPTSDSLFLKWDGGLMGIHFITII